jgi:hypothetical protein
VVEEGDLRAAKLWIAWRCDRGHIPAKALQGPVQFFMAGLEDERVPRIGRAISAAAQHAAELAVLADQRPEPTDIDLTGEIGINLVAALGQQPRCLEYIPQGWRWRDEALGPGKGKKLGFPARCCASLPQALWTRQGGVHVRVREDRVEVSRDGDVAVQPKGVVDKSAVALSLRPAAPELVQLLRRVGSHGRVLHHGGTERGLNSFEEDPGLRDDGRGDHVAALGEADLVWDAAEEGDVLLDQVCLGEVHVSHLGVVFLVLHMPMFSDLLEKIVRKS